MPGPGHRTPDRGHRLDRTVNRLDRDLDGIGAIDGSGRPANRIRGAIDDRILVVAPGSALAQQLHVPDLIVAAVIERDPFAALADPTRRHILELLARDGPSTATALAGELDISRQAVAKHLQLLAGAGVADGQRVGRETRFEATPGGLAEVQRWIAHIEDRWTSRLDLLARSVEAASARPSPTQPGGDGGEEV